MITTNAVILAAGMASRLHPLTDTIPKCLLRVNEHSILENALYALSKVGVSEVRIVVGYLSDVVKQRIGEHFLDMEIIYIDNKIYERTNSMYSLHLGLNNLSKNTWILEGDIFFTPDILQKKTADSFCWFVDEYNPEMDGAFLTCNRDNYATSLEIIRERNIPNAENLYKSVGILHLDSYGVKNLKSWLFTAVEENKLNLYYDLIVEEHIGTLPIRLIDIHGTKWYEIDDFHDLERAQNCFQKEIDVRL